MAYTPLMNQNYVQQSFSQVISGPNLLGMYVVVTQELAPATNSFVYYPGAVLAQYTAGSYDGQVVNWVEGGSNGQQTVYGILIEQYINPTISATIPAGTFVKVMMIGRVVGDQLSVTAGSDVNVALYQFNAVAFPQPDLTTAYDLRGPTVANPDA